MKIADIVAGDEVARSETRLRLLISLLLLQFMEQLESQAPVLDEDLTSSKRTVQIFLNRAAACAGRELDARKHGRRVQPVANAVLAALPGADQHDTGRYLQMVRLEAAKKWLSERASATVTEIALECGFSSSQYFATCYKRRFGLSPQQTRIIAVDACLKHISVP